MGIEDIRTAIEGNFWVAAHVGNPAKRVESIFALQDLGLKISRDSKLCTGSLRKDIKYVLRMVNTGACTSAIMGSYCCRHCRYTRWGYCKCAIRDALHTWE